MSRMTALAPGARVAHVDPTLETAPRSTWRELGAWIGAGLVALQLLLVAFSIQDARWILGRRDLTDFLGWIAFLSVLLGTLLGMAGISRLKTYWAAALIGALVLLAVVGGIIAPEADLRGAMRAAAISATEAYLDLAWRGKLLTEQVGHYMLSLGVVVWGTGVFAAYAVVRRRRPVDAIFASGLVLLVNMSLSRVEQLPYLVAFTAVSLLLLARVHATDEVAAWVRGRMGDTEGVGDRSVRGAVAFSAIAIAASLVLTSTASSAPLADAWTGIRQAFVDLGLNLERYLPHGDRKSTRLNSSH